jgi:hypothetical protein
MMANMAGYASYVGYAGWLSSLFMLAMISDCWLDILVEMLTHYDGCTDYTGWLCW